MEKLTQEFNELSVRVAEKFKEINTRLDTNDYNKVKEELDTRLDDIKRDLNDKLEEMKRERIAAANRQVAFGSSMPVRVRSLDQLQQLQPQYSPESVKLAQRFLDDLHIFNVLTKRRHSLHHLAKEYAPHFTRNTGVEVDHLFESLTGRAITVAGASGTAMFPQGFSAELEREIQLSLDVAMLFRETQMPQNPFTKPFRTRITPAEFLGELVAATAKDWTDSDITLTAKRLVAYMQYSDEAELGALFPLASEIRDSSVRSVGDAIEQSILDGDTAGTMDSGVAAKDCRLAYNGLRYSVKTAAAADVDFSGAPTFSLMMGLRKLMKRMGAPRAASSSLAWIVGLSGYAQLTTMTEFKTLDVYGPRATNITGEVGSIGGIPVIISQFVREDLNAVGDYDGVTETKTYILLVNRMGFERGNYGMTQLETDKTITTGGNDVVATRRHAFIQVHPDSATIGYPVARGYNIPS